VTHQSLCFGGSCEKKPWVSRAENEHLARKVKFLAGTYVTDGARNWLIHRDTLGQEVSSASIHATTTTLLKNSRRGRKLDISFLFPHFNLQPVIRRTRMQRIFVSVKAKIIRSSHTRGPERKSFEAFWLHFGSRDMRGSNTVQKLLSKRLCA